MKIFNAIDTISIKNNGGAKTIRINGGKVTPYGFNGLSFLASQIEAINVNDLGMFSPILVEFDNDYTIANKSTHLETIVVAMTIIAENIIELFVTFVDPDDIDGKAMHELFQRTLESVVIKHSRIELFEPVEGLPTKKSNKKRKNINQESNNYSPSPNDSNVGFVQFTTYAETEKFGGIFHILNEVVLELDKKTRSLMKKSK